MSTEDITWIDWNDGQGYRKITDYDVSGLKWYDWKWGENWEGENKSYDDHTHPTGTMELVEPNDLRYIWYLDKKNKDLKISPLNSQECDPDKECCTDSLMVDESIPSRCYKESNKSPYGGSCEKKCRVFVNNQTIYDTRAGPFYSGEGKSGDEQSFNSNWHYYGDGHNKKFGTFCNTVTLDQGFLQHSDYSLRFPYTDKSTGEWYTYTDGYDNVHVGDSNVMPYQCDESKAFPSYAHRIIDELNAAKCCSLSYQDVKNRVEGSDPELKMCSESFNPHGSGNSCTPLMQNFCRNYWGDDIGSSYRAQLCDKFIHNSPSSREFIRSTSINYITNRNRSPPDYTSPKLLNPTPQQRSAIDAGRDDSKDPFFTTTFPYMCKIPMNDDNPKLPPCDDILDDFCAQFTRDDLLADNTLHNICGCHLNNQEGGRIYSILTDQNTGNGLVNPSQYDNQYYIGTSQNCDPVCLGAVQSVDGQCTTPVCILDGTITVGGGSSVGGDIIINQMCGNGGTCYISQDTIDVLGKSSVGGNISLNQTCGDCFVFNGDNINTGTEIDCSSLQPAGTPIPKPDGSKPTKSDSLKDRWKNLTTGAKVGLGIILAFIVILIGYLIYKYTVGKEVVNPFEDYVYK